MIQPERKPGTAWDFDRLETTTVRSTMWAKLQGLT